MDSKFPFVESINAPLPNIEPTLAIGPTHPPNILSVPGENEKYLGTICKTSVNISVLIPVWNLITTKTYLLDH